MLFYKDSDDASEIIFNTWNVSFTQMHEDQNQIDILLGTFDRTVTLLDYNLIQEYSQYLTLVLSNHTVLIYRIDTLRKTAELFLSKAYSTPQPDFETRFFLLDDYIMLTNISAMLTTASADGFISIFKLNQIDPSQTMTNPIYTFETGSISDSYDAKLFKRKNRFTIIIHSFSNNLQVYELGNENALFCKHINVHKISYDSKWTVSQMAFYQSDSSQMPIIIIEEEQVSYPMFLTICAPGFFFHPLYQGCVACEAGFISSGGRTNRCQWCDGFYSDLNKVNPITDATFNKDFFTVAESCYVDKGYSSECL